METISEIVRKKEIEKLVGLITTNTLFKNWLVQGMPGVGIDYVFRCLSVEIDKAAISRQKVKVVNIDFASLWPTSLSKSLFQHFVRPLPLTIDSSEVESKDLTALLDLLRTTIKNLSDEGWQFIYIFNHFDSVLKFSHAEDVQLLLNTFQSLCYEGGYKTCNIVECYRDIEDICRHTNYSDYYKVFGTNHTRIGHIASTVLEQEMTKFYSHITSGNIKQIIELCGGYPELSEVILRDIGTDSDRTFDKLEIFDRYNVFAAAFPFNRWIDCLTPDEVIVLERVNKNKTLDKELSFHTRKLLRKDLLKENRLGEISFVSPLFEHYVTMERVPVESSTGEVTIKRVGLLDNLQKQLLEELFNNRFMIELKLQQDPLPGNAFVYMVTGEDEKGVPYRPCIVKLDDSARSERENKNLETARQMLGTIVPSVLKRTRLRGQDAVILEYATADNKNYAVMQFADYFQTRNSNEVAKLLEKVFVHALAPFYLNPKIAQKDAKSLYFLPRLHHGEYDILSNLARKSRYFRSNNIHIPGTDQELQDAGEYLKPALDKTSSKDTKYEKFFVSKRKVGLSMAHGDLNPRNLLIDGIGNIHIIDFSELKQEGSRFLDFARLESEIKFKLAAITHENFERVIALEIMMIDVDNLTELELISRLPLDNEIEKVALSVFTLRKIAYSMGAEKVAFQDFATEYLLGLLTQTLRIALFQDYISDVQQEYAILSAGLIINKLEKLEVS